MRRVALGGRASFEVAERMRRANFTLTFCVADLLVSFSPAWELRKSTLADRWPEKILPKPPRRDPDPSELRSNLVVRVRRISMNAIFVCRRVWP